MGKEAPSDRQIERWLLQRLQLFLQPFQGVYRQLAGEMLADISGGAVLLKDALMQQRRGLWAGFAERNGGYRARTVGARELTQHGLSSLILIFTDRADQGNLADRPDGKIEALQPEGKRRGVLDHIILQRTQHAFGLGAPIGAFVISRQVQECTDCQRVT